MPAESTSHFLLISDMYVLGTLHALIILPSSIYSLPSSIIANPVVVMALHHWVSNVGSFAKTVTAILLKMKPLHMFENYGMRKSVDY